MFTSPTQTLGPRSVIYQNHAIFPLLSDYHLTNYWLLQAVQVAESKWSLCLWWYHPLWNNRDTEYFFRLFFHVICVILLYTVQVCIMDVNVAGMKWVWCWVVYFWKWTDYIIFLQITFLLCGFSFVRSSHCKFWIVIHCTCKNMAANFLQIKVWFHLVYKSLVWGFARMWAVWLSSLLSQYQLSWVTWDHWKVLYKPVPDKWYVGYRIINF